MSSVNKAILIGHLGKTPELRYTSSNTEVCNFSMATTEKWRDKQTGEPVEKTEWHNVVCYKKLAEIASKYLQKGARVYIEGKIRTRKWQDKETGADRYMTEIEAVNLVLLGAKQEGVSYPPDKPAVGNGIVETAPWNRKSEGENAYAKASQSSSRRAPAILEQPPEEDIPF